MVETGIPQNLNNHIEWLPKDIQEAKDVQEAKDNTNSKINHTLWVAHNISSSWFSQNIAQDLDLLDKALKKRVSEMRLSRDGSRNNYCGF